jgi:DNA-binding NarL/FixJ family response regulator
MSNAEIADHLTISPATAKTHVGHLLAKLSARDRVQLVIVGYQHGLVLARGDDPPEPPAALRAPLR